jgi:hypothetical protein
MRKFIPLPFLLVLTTLLCSHGFAQIGQLGAMKKTEGFGSGALKRVYWKNNTKLPTDYWQQDVYYNIKARIDDKVQKLDGQLSLQYVNNSPDALTDIYFNLYQNAFTPNSYLHNRRELSRLETKFGENERLRGGTVIKDLQVNNKKVEYTIDNTILHIKLDKPLQSGSIMKFDIEFTTYWDNDDQGNIRRRMKTFRHGGKDNKEFLHFDGVHWYPRIAVYDRKFGWNINPHLGKEFYGDFGVFNVELSFPKEYVVEATGKLMNPEEVYPGDLRQRLDISNFKERKPYSYPIKADGSYKTWRYVAHNVHDFAFTADPTYRIGEVDYKGIQCIALAQEEHAYRWQETAAYVARLIETYSNDFGMYEYPKMVAADARDGMEYPMLTLNSGLWPGHRYVIAHEVGHNWFFGMIGNNETYRASLDEGFTQFLTAWSLRKEYKVTSRPNGVDDGVVYAGYMQHVSTENTARLNIHSDHFHSAQGHGGGYGQVYYKTATMLYNLQYILGDSLFLESMKNYVATWKFAHPYWEDFRQSIIDYTKADLNYFFDQWIETTSTIDYRIKKVKPIKGTDSSQIVLERLGMSMPLDVRVTYADGSKKDYYIPNSYFEKKTWAETSPRWVGWDDVNPTYVLKVEGNAIKDVQIDPSGRLADVNLLDNKKKMPVRLEYDKWQGDDFHWRSYIVKYRPALWYNAIDGLKVGLYSKGHYYNKRHAYEARVWYNTGLQFHNTPEASVTNRDLVNVDLNYSNKLSLESNLKLGFRYLDGWTHGQVNFDRQLGQWTGSLGAHVTERRNTNYLLFPSLANSGFDNWIEASLSRNLRFKKSNMRISMETTASTLWSDYNFGGVSIGHKGNRRIGKLRFVTHSDFRWMEGNVAPERQVLLNGGSIFELMGNSFYRSIGWVYGSPQSFTPELNMINAEGGVRGNFGYLATNTNETDTFSSFSGVGGAFWSGDLHFGKYIPLKARKLKRFIQVDPYLFTDLGILFVDNNRNSGLRMSSGIGMDWKFKAPMLRGLKPLVVGVDFPLFMNRLPSSEEYFAFRYTLTIKNQF